MLRYLELKSGHSDNGPAWIGRVQLSRSGRTVYFDGKAFKRGNGIGANHFDIVTGDEYWISGVKKNGQDRHWTGSGKITIEAAAVEEYLKIVGAKEIDRKRFVISHKIQPTDPTRFCETENAGPMAGKKRFNAPGWAK
jgi:hypothetical protein